MRRIKKLRISSFRHLLKFALFTVKVYGESAWPVLIPGKTYLASRILPPRKGDFIVFQNPKNNKEIFVKQVQKCEVEGYRVSSLVSWGSSSENFGIVDKNLILGKILQWTFKTRPQNKL